MSVIENLTSTSHWLCPTALGKEKKCSKSSSRQTLICSWDDKTESSRSRQIIFVFCTHAGKKQPIYTRFCVDAFLSPFSSQFHGLSETLGPFRRFSERMQSGSLGVGAIGMPFLHRPLKLRPVPRARHSDVQTLDHAVFGYRVHLLTAWDFVHTFKVHAPCCKLVLAVLAEMCMVGVVDWELGLAIPHLRQQRAECQTRENFQTPMWKEEKTWFCQACAYTSNHK